MVPCWRARLQNEAASCPALWQQLEEQLARTVALTFPTLPTGSRLSGPLNLRTARGLWELAGLGGVVLLMPSGQASPLASLEASSRVGTDRAPPAPSPSLQGSRGREARPASGRQGDLSGPGKPSTQHRS